MRIRWFVVPALLLVIAGHCSAVPLLHAQTDNWQLVEARDLYDELIDRVLAENPQYVPAEGQRARHSWDMLTLSPDGTLIVGWGRFQRTDITEGRVIEDLVCRFEIDSDVQQCVLIERDDLLITPINASMAWSPDGAQLALTGDTYLRQEDGDILLLDIATLTLANLTDDGYTGKSVGADVPAGLPVDAAPVWSPSGDLYFFRVLNEGEVQTTGLYRLAGAAGEPELVTELPEDISTFGIWNTNNAAMSPDGTMLALIPKMLWAPPHTHGVWLVDLTTGTVAQRFAPDAMQPELAEWSELRTIPEDEVPLIPQHVVWSGDGRLIIYANNPAYSDGKEPVDAINLLSVDMQNDAITPLVDFTTFDSADAASETPLSVPGMGILAPDGQMLFYMARRPFDINAVFVVPLAFDMPPVVIGTLPDDLYDALRVRMGRAELGYILQAAANGRALFGTILLTFEQ